MADVKWIKIVTDIFDDEKILIIESMPESDSIIVIWFKLLCLAGKQNNSGVFTINGRIPCTDEMFAAIFRRPVGTVRLALKTFEGLGMIEIINDTVTIPKWGKHQSLEQIASRKAYMRKYMQDYREKQRLLGEGAKPDEKGTKDNKNACVNTNVNINTANSKCHVSAPEGDIEEEGDIEGDKSNVVCTEPPVSGRSMPAEKPDSGPIDFIIHLKGDAVYNVPAEDVEEYRRLYPGVDVEQQLRNMEGWSIDAGPNRKTEQGVKRFITRWLIREQNTASKASVKGGVKNGISQRSADEGPRRLYAGETIV